ncbi:MAG: FIG00452441: hypothetical protein [uncultured Paraburkholderia sp.]|nr:MAG: FIG00452441: hypothetical protein [uncultured Paraburkholderia sp.]CAH2944715.1 MAG: FIG00452441: hypothetical protein [uncultured Paraburkholderia sp.]
MKIRILSIACVTAAATLLAACTAVYKNSDACEQLMRSKLAEKSSDPLKISHTGAAIRGSRVVVEGSFEHLMTASEARAASASLGASAGARSEIRGSSAEIAASAASAASAATVASTSMGSAASAASAAAAVRASGADVVLDKSGKPKKVTTQAAAECMFHGTALDAFNWLAPSKFATPAEDAAASDATE